MKQVDDLLGADLPRLEQVDDLLRFDLPSLEQVDDLLGTGEAAVGGEEDVDVGGVDVGAVGAELLDESVERAVADDAHLLQTPLLDRALVITVVRL